MLKFNFSDSGCIDVHVFPSNYRGLGIQSYCLFKRQIAGKKDLNIYLC